MLIAQTADWVVVAKPAGWLTIPDRHAEAQATPVVRDWATREFGRVWIVHRLDRETSGVLLLARSEAAHRRANEWFAKHLVKKTYECLARGAPPTPVFKISEAIEGKPSQTQVEVRERFAAEVFFARVRPQSGRRHQIRIHLAHEGYPILGDTLYGGAREIVVAPGHSLAIARVALHAVSLELPTGEKFTAKYPDDFSGWLQQLRAAPVPAS